MATITVRGSASRPVQPDRVVVSLGLTQLAKDAPSALDAVAQRSEKLAELLAALDVPRDQWVTEGVNVAEEFEWRKESQVSVGYRATSGVAATLQNLDAIGPLLRDAVGSCQASVRNLTWLVDADNPARRELLADAARAARDRAEAYADALGLRLGHVELVSDDPIVTAPGSADHDAAMSYGARMKVAAPEAAMDVSGGLVTLSAEVYVRFGTVPAS